MLFKNPCIPKLIFLLNDSSPHTRYNNVLLMF